MLAHCTEECLGSRQHISGSRSGLLPPANPLGCLLALTESPNGDINHIPSPLLEGSPCSLPLPLPEGILSISPIAQWGDGTFFVSSLVLRGDAGGRAGCSVRIGMSQWAHLFPEPD